VGWPLGPDPYLLGVACRSPLLATHIKWRLLQGHTLIRVVNCLILFFIFYIK
jgi:hypothetical protein